MYQFEAYYSPVCW